MTTPKASSQYAGSILRERAVAAVFACILLGTIQQLWARPRQDSSKPEKPYALIYGTVYGPDDHPVYGVKVRIRRADEKKVRWEHYSDHAGEFAQRVPAGRADYVIWADLKGYKSERYKGLQPGSEVTVHIENDERSDISVHLK